MATGFTTSQLVAFLLVLTRTGAWLWLTPPFGGRAMPVPVRVILSVALSVVLTPRAAQTAVDLPTSTPGTIGAVVVQAAIGTAMGLACLTLLSAVQAAGGLVDLFGGFSLSQAFDPLLLQQSAVMSRLYQLLAAVLLLVTGAHMVLLEGLQGTFEALPLGSVLDLGATASSLASGLSTMFVAALQIVGPLIGVTVVADLGLGLLSRVAPTLNVFSLSFPVKIGLTLLLLALAVPMLPPAVRGLSDDAVRSMSTIAGG